MALQFAVLASGSRGNATWARAGGAGLLIDLGLGPRVLEARLEQVGARGDELAAALLTHTHSDHIKPDTLRWLANRKVPLFCHEGHGELLSTFRGFRALDKMGLVHRFDDRPFLTPAGFRAEAITLSHDGGPTFGFRIEARQNQRGRATCLGYVTDTGLWTDQVATALADADLLAIEFNHDVDMQRRSGRPPALINRVLGDRGHLSNEQAAGLVAEVLRISAPGRARHLVLLHLSQQCNQPALASSTARAVVREAGRRIAVHAAQQDIVTPRLFLQPNTRTTRSVATGAQGPRRSVGKRSSSRTVSRAQAHRDSFLFCQ